MKNLITSRLTAFLCAAVMVLGLTACGAKITRLSLPTGAVLEKGETLQMDLQYDTETRTDADALAEAAEKLELLWTSDDETVAVVDENGLVTAVANGEADITVTLTQAFPAATGETATAESARQPVTLTATTHVTVTTAAERIELDKTEGVLTVGSTHKIKASVLPDTATDQTLTWTSSDESVAAADENGKVTAKKAGSAVITASCGEVSAQYQLTVQNVKCSYCGKTGHTSSGCPTKAADEAAAQAAAEQAAQQQAQQEQAAQESGGSSGGDSGFTIDPNATPGSGFLFPPQAAVACAALPRTEAQK